MTMAVPYSYGRYSSFDIPSDFAILTSSLFIMNRRHFLPILPAALFSGCGKDETPKLTVGMEANYPPFEFKNEKGELDGVDVRIAEALAAHVGLPLKINDYAFEGLIPALQGGQIDCIISAMTATDERRKSINFSDPYVFTGIAMLVHKDAPVQSVADLQKRGLRIVAKIATTGESYAREHLPKAQLRVLDQENTCADEVAKNLADVFIYDQLSIFGHWETRKDTTRALLTPIREEQWAIGIRKGNDDLRLKVNAFIKEFRDKGGLNQLADRYLVKERKLLEEMGVPFIFR
jgi:polar amino acid transport system substrate-binding protein